MHQSATKPSYARLAMTGLMGTAAGLLMTACGENAESTSETSPAAAPSPTTQAVDMQKYMDIHDCAGLNTCKGLGGCHVDAAKLKKLAEKAGVPMDKAGQPHDCSGLNACKGLGGCHVDAAKLQKLKAKLAG
ncbi:MAG TPA: hypothetical protein DCM28_22175 [Phycisphaerales bacterium]|nr:hypothetical protein [Phycisphaerales bacterium]HCD32893.1 hypothetical protein [Phycisphaerales bacterium]|tara:strand:- start:37 stop:432 length:396 start_codon:yes stop_codon:yes gene_type:complete